jgi:syntaxin-binding protein 5
VEDEDKPLLVRTLEDIDINVVDGEMLSEILGQEQESSPQKPLVEPPEPIFKLSWCPFSNSSDARGGATALVVLGGGRARSDPQGVTTLALPAFNPSEIPDTKSGPKLSSTMRTSMRDSVMPSDLYTYTTSGIIHDYFLLPCDNPHFAGDCDPIALIILSETTFGTRSTTFHEFPPLILGLRPIEQSKATPSGADSVTQDLASTLDAMKLADDPRQLLFPTLLWNGSSSITEGDIIKLESEQYKSLLGGSVDGVEKSFVMSGGAAWAGNTEDENRHAKVRS